MAFVLEKDIPLDFVNDKGIVENYCFEYVAVDRDRDAFVWGGATFSFDFRSDSPKDYVNSFNYFLLIRGQQYSFRLEEKEINQNLKNLKVEGKPCVYAWSKVLGIFDATDKTKLYLPSDTYEELIKILKEGMMILGRPRSRNMIPNFIVPFDF